MTNFPQKYSQVMMIAENFRYRQIFIEAGELLQAGTSLARKSGSRTTTNLHSWKFLADGLKFRIDRRRKEVHLANVLVLTRESDLRHGFHHPLPVGLHGSLHPGHHGAGEAAGCTCGRHQLTHAAVGEKADSRRDAMGRVAAFSAPRQ